MVVYFVQLDDPITPNKISGMFELFSQGVGNKNIYGVFNEPSLVTKSMNDVYLDKHDNGGTDGSCLYTAI